MEKLCVQGQINGIGSTTGSQNQSWYVLTYEHIRYYNICQTMDGSRMDHK